MGQHPLPRWDYLGIGLLGAVFLLRGAITQLLVRGGRFVDESIPSAQQTH